MSKFDETVAKALSENLIDERKVLAFSTAKALPGGEYGLCLLCLNGNTLRVYDTDFSQNIGRMMYKIELNSISNVKSSSFVLQRYLKFEYRGNQYHLANFGDAKRILEAILQESNNR